jgi:glutamine amidotransferase
LSPARSEAQGADGGAPVRVAVFDYGAGNLHSLVKALAAPGFEVYVEPDPIAATRAGVLILPGVGAFGPAAEAIGGARDAMRVAITRGLPTLGICLGMQLLFESSDEGSGTGLGVIPGRVERLQARRLPQIGWNSLDEISEPLLEQASMAEAYYANSYVCRTADASVVTAWTRHEDDRFAAAVRAGNAVGVQFHPEKSSAPGVRFVRAFLDEARRAIRRGSKGR